MFAMAIAGAEVTVAVPAAAEVQFVETEGHTGTEATVEARAETVGGCRARRLWSKSSPRM